MSLTRLTRRIEEFEFANGLAAHAAAQTLLSQGGNTRDGYSASGYSISYTPHGFTVSYLSRVLYGTSERSEAELLLGRQAIKQLGGGGSITSLYDRVMNLTA